MLKLWTGDAMMMIIGSRRKNSNLLVNFAIVSWHLIRDRDKVMVSLWWSGN